jgi:hypothetical protein
VLPPNELIQTSRGLTSLLPTDGDYYTAILQAVRKGLKVLVFPMTGTGDPLNPMRRIFGLEDIRYGARAPQEVTWPASWGGGAASGCACVVEGTQTDVILLRNTEGRPLVVFRPCGAGGFLLAGYDTAPDSLDGDFRYDTALHLRQHTLVRLMSNLGLASKLLHTGQTCCYKECLYGSQRDYLLFYNHHPKPLTLQVEFRSIRRPGTALELSTGRRQQVLPAATPGWFYFAHRIPALTGSYMVID